MSRTSEANDAAPVNEANKANDQTAPEIRVLKGNPTDADIAAVVTVLAGLSGAPADSEPAEINLWGHPVDKLRFPMTTMQRITLLERTHVRR